MPAWKARPAAAPPRLDPLVHEPMRLRLLAALAAQGALGFTDLKELLGATDGNLAIHARRLEEAGYVGMRKSFEGRVPRTEYRLTAKGRSALSRYAADMAALLAPVRR